MVIKIEGFKTADRANDAMEEYDIHKALTAIGSQYILACHGSSLRERTPQDVGPTLLLYGYTDYAPFGDLSHALKNAYYGT